MLKSAISVQDDPFHNSVKAFCPAGEESLYPPTTKPKSTEFPVPAKSYLTELMSVISVQAVPFQDSTLVVSAEGAPPAIKPEVFKEPKAAAYVLAVLTFATSVQDVPSQVSESAG